MQYEIEYRYRWVREDHFGNTTKQKWHRGKESVFEEMSRVAAERHVRKELNSRAIHSLIGYYEIEIINIS